MADNTTKLKEVLSEFKGMEYIDSEWREAIRKLESVIASMEAQEPIHQACMNVGGLSYAWVDLDAKSYEAAKELGDLNTRTLYTHPSKSK